MVRVDRAWDHSVSSTGNRTKSDTSLHVRPYEIPVMPPSFRAGRYRPPLPTGKGCGALMRATRAELLLQVPSDTCEVRDE